MNVYVRSNGKIFGPVDFSKVALACQDGLFSQNAEISEDRIEWLSIAEAQELLKPKNAAPLPPAPDNAPVLTPIPDQPFSTSVTENFSYPPKKKKLIIVVICAFLVLALISILTFVLRQAEENKDISITVNVQKYISMSGESWKYNCEYKLYANDNCIASKNSTSMSVTFRVKVQKGAVLRAEMLPKNGFGGIAETLEGPAFGESAKASRDGDVISIKCI